VRNSPQPSWQKNHVQITKQTTMMDPGKCKPVPSIKNLTYFSSFCFLFLFSSFQDKKPLADVMSLFARQKGLFDCCFFVKFHWCHPHTNWNSLKNCPFHFPFVSISSGTTREAFWLSGRNIQTTVNIGLWPL